jgi:hypothetical protein
MAGRDGLRLSREVMEGNLGGSVLSFCISAVRVMF